MNPGEHVSDPAKAAELVSDLLEHVRREGRRVLVVIGAGCSSAAGMPLMRDVYSYLHSELKSYEGKSKQLQNLRAWLQVLERDCGPRSLAAQALGLLQQPQLIAQDLITQDLREKPREFLERLWRDFATAFLTWKVGTQSKLSTTYPTILHAEPTRFHKKVASWVRKRLAIVFSLNFDGLTRKAIEEDALNDQRNERCVILSRREEMYQYFFGDHRDDDSNITSPLWAVIKARGDVFHATCRNDLCPACDRPAAIYDLRRQLELQKRLTKAHDSQSTPDNSGHQVNTTSEHLQLAKVHFIGASQRENSENRRLEKSEGDLILQCPECGTPRYLEISFTGYQRKEEEAEDLLDGMRECVMPGIGGLIIAGVSGLWDDALVEMFVKTGQSWKLDPTMTSGNSAPSRIICIDQKSEGDRGEPFLVQRLNEAGVTVHFAPTGAEELAASLSLSKLELIGQEVQERDFEAPFQGDKRVDWVNLMLDPCKAPESLSRLGEFRDPIVRERFGKLRQLGLKTALVNFPGVDQQWKERNHNRLVHSAGAAVIGLGWLKRILGRRENGEILGVPQFPSSVLKSAVFLACLTHDLGHLPFTHLAEDVFAELHWTTSPWAERFHHATGVLDSCQEALRNWANGTIKVVDGKLMLPADFAVLRTLVSRATEGRSGIFALDAIVNSPLDADKIEYVVSDCVWMKQDVHLPMGDGLKSWLDVFFRGQHILPSGVLAISGPAAENAYRLLEERRWLYKNLYFRPAFRVVERVVHHLLVRWLTWHVGEELAKEVIEGKSDILARWSRDGGLALHAPSIMHTAITLGDARCIKGRKAAGLLWDKLMKAGDDAGEPKLARELAEELSILHANTSLKDWYADCALLLTTFLDPPKKQEYAQFEEALTMGATWSSRMYIRRSDLDQAREIVRNLEYGSLPNALIDLAALPPMLSYPDARRFTRGKRQLHADCWAVPHKDPERWGRETGRWVPLGKTAMARHDREVNRWVQILMVSPRPDDRPALQYLEDRFRSACDKEEIRIFDEEPPMAQDE